MSFFRKPADNSLDPSLEAVRQKIAASDLPDYVSSIATRELELLSKIDPGVAEYTIGLTYIEYLIAFPWTKKTEDNLDLQRAEMILNARHYGLENIKNRIIEHLAVKILKSSKKPYILVVDDEAIALKNMVRLLRKDAYYVDSADNGVTAFEKIQQVNYDVVLTDLKMEGLDGLALLSRIKIRSPETQVIMITGYASIENAIETIKKGAFQYIQKPIKADELRKVVREALDNRLTTRSTKGSVLCFAGPPGTGKTSLGRSIAEALGRKFSRISLGGIRDEAEIRGHRRTYAGAMPGRIIEEIKMAGVINPVIMLDELDKCGQDFKGDSLSALLEVFDPEQNHSFLDHYLDVPFDLSNVMFIGTANIAENMDSALLDRMEVVAFPGYTEDEKIEIAMKYLIPKQIDENGLIDDPPEFTHEAVSKIINDYTREAGIRNLEREIASVCRKIATEVVHNGKRMEAIVTPDNVEKYLGPRRFYLEIAGEEEKTGVATGVVWTETGGAIIFVESVRMKGSGELILTGSLGEVMRESAQTALSYIRSNASMLGIEEDFLSTSDLHVHVPAGAIPKDGPSAGATIAISLISLMTGKAARRSVAVTGEITLTGRMLPVGGIRAKILAAKQAGVKQIVFPSKNMIDIQILPDNIRSDIEIYYASSIDEIKGYVFKD